MRVMAACHTMHHTDLNMIQYEMLGYVAILLISTSKAQVLRDPSQNHTEIPYEQNILLAEDLLLKNSF